MHFIRRQAHRVTWQIYNPFARQRSRDATPDTDCGDKLAPAKQMPQKSKETKDVENPRVVGEAKGSMNSPRVTLNTQEDLGLGEKTEETENVGNLQVVKEIKASVNPTLLALNRLRQRRESLRYALPTPSTIEQTKLRTYTWSTSLSSTLDQYMSQLFRSFKGSPGPFTSLSLMTFLIPSVSAQVPGANSTMTWKQRAMQVLTSAAASCAFLVPPAIILMLGGSMSHWLLRKRREHALGGMMLFMAIVYTSIKVGPKADPTGSNEIIRTAVGLVYLLFMLGYCRRVILRNERGQGTSVKATFVGVGIGLAMIAIAPFRDLFWKLTGLEPYFFIPLTIPLGFLLCDLEIAVETAFAGRARDARGANQDFDVESQMRGRYYLDSTDIWADLHHRRPHVSAAQDYEMDDSFHADSPTIVHTNPWADTPSASIGFWGRYFSWANFF
jgi:hypothetical protein